MKKTGILFTLLLAAIFFTSCSTSKEARTYKNIIDGEWQLQTIVTEGITGKIKAQLFNEEDFNCFIGSSWIFNRNNSFGTYSISQNAGECEAIKRNIKWSIYEAKDEPKLFQFKKLDDNHKEIEEGSAGYRFTILQLDKSVMKLRNDIIFEGKQASFIFNFIRN